MAVAVAVGRRQPEPTERQAKSVETVAKDCHQQSQELQLCTDLVAVASVRTVAALLVRMRVPDIRLLSVETELRTRAAAVVEQPLRTGRVMVVAESSSSSSVRCRLPRQILQCRQ